jgi:hypothetical protein
MLVVGVVAAAASEEGEGERFGSSVVFCGKASAAFFSFVALGAHTYKEKHTKKSC